MTGAERKIHFGDSLAPLAAKEDADRVVGEETTKVRRLLADSHARIAELTAQTELVERVYLGEFLPDVTETNKVATDIVSGLIDVTTFDPISFGEHGESPESIKHYLSSFEAFDPTQTYPFPQITFPATAILDYNGVEHTVSSYATGLRPLERYMFSPHFRSGIELATLVDPEIRTLDELAELEPGHGMQLREAFHLAREAQGDKASSFQDPQVVRMVAILPTGTDYATDFVPKVTLAPRENDAWDPYLMVRGAFNSASNYLSTDMGISRETIAFDADGREASLRVRRPEAGSYAEQSTSLMPLASHELNTLGVMLFPYALHKRPQQISPPVESGMYGGAVGRKSVGGAEIGTGQIGWTSAGKSEGRYGSKILPVEGGRPVVYSVRLLTTAR